MALPDAVSWKRLSPMLDELLRLTPVERQARVRAAIERGETLAPQLESLLAAARKADEARFMQGRSAGAESLNSFLAGRQVGAYVVCAAVGEGATGKVWSAHRAGAPAERVALKLLHLSLVGQAAAMRFRREAVILERVAHPNIAGLLDSGVTVDGQPYLVLELVDGSPIDRHCDARAMDVKARVRLFLDVLAAVAHAHERGVVHRDIKPGNVHVTREGQVKLLDFGIAKMLVQGPDGPPVTAAGRRLLTPLYAAPEQLDGRPLSKSADIYSLGVLLYQLLSGTHPTTPSCATPAQSIRATLEARPRPLPAALGPRSGIPLAGRYEIAACRGMALHVLQQQLDAGLWRILKRALRKDPAARYADVEAFAADLRRYLSQDQAAPAMPALLRALARLLA
jgi:serine/threonine protein kinase